MKVNIDILEKIIHSLFSELKEKNGNQIEIESDYYWDISNEEMYNPYEEPANMSLGQLSDDLAEIMRLQKDDSAIPYDFHRVANILKILGFEKQF